MKTVVILMASGLSRRFDGDKLLADFLGKAVLTHSAKAARQLPCHRFLAVCNDNPNRQALLSDYEIIENPTPEKGQGEAIALGAKAAIALGAEHVLIVLGDMPLVPLSHLQALLSASPDAQTVMSECGGVLMPPARFSGEALSVLAHLSGDKGVRPSISAETVTVALSSMAAKDIDTRAGLAQIEAKLKGRM